MASSQEPEEMIPELDFTQRAFETFYDVVDDPYFRDQDPDVIYATLKDKVQIVSFGDFLKRYIYEKAGMSGNYKEIPVTEYRDIICDAFTERQTPASFTPTTVRLRNLAKNWLEQKTVSRTLVLLLGFGLGMSTEDVNTFLIKALKEQRLNAKDPFEVICWYCYTYGCGYVKFEQLWNEYRQTGGKESVAHPALDATSEFKQRMLSIKDEDQLMGYLKGLPIMPGTTRQSVMARQQFDQLYRKTREWVADVLTGIEENESRVSRDRMAEKLDRDDRYYDFEKRAMLEKADGRYHRYSGTEIGAAQFEQVAFASIPKDKNGNMLPLKASTLNSQFAGARLNRQHLSEILSGKAQITRYDLITLSFLAFLRDTDEDMPALKRYSAFIDATNGILEKSDMGPMYPVNPYESFIMMCVLSDDPIGTFSDVWELSYSGE